MRGAGYAIPLPVGSVGLDPRRRRRSERLRFAHAAALAQVDQSVLDELTVLGARHRAQVSLERGDRALDLAVRLRGTADVEQQLRPLAQSVSVEQVRMLAQRARSVAGDSLLQVVNELGWSNHPDALPALLELARHEREEVRGAALGAIGTLGVSASFEPLKQLYAQAGGHTDRFMALKAIGDLDTPEARAFLAAVHAAPGDDEDEIREITSLYVEGREAAPSAVAVQSVPPALARSPDSARSGRAR